MIRFSELLTSKQHLSFFINSNPFFKSSNVKGGLGIIIRISRELYLFDKADTSVINDEVDGDDDSLINLNISRYLLLLNDSNNTRSNISGGIPNSNSYQKINIIIMILRIPLY
jgi:hypothetical protein